MVRSSGLSSSLMYDPSSSWDADPVLELCGKHADIGLLGADLAVTFGTVGSSEWDTLFEIGFDGNKPHSLLFS